MREATARPSWTQVAGALSLVLFPLLFLVFAGTDLHPDPDGETAADQVRAVAQSEAQWRLVHLVLSAASLLGIAAVLTLWALIPGAGARHVVATVIAAMGVAGAGLLAGVVLMEASAVAPVAASCARTPFCVSPQNEAFLTELANASWNKVTPLGRTAATLILALVLLALIGAFARSVRPWEAAVMAVGMVGIYATNTGLHSGAQFGLALLLVAGASIAFRIVTGRSAVRRVATPARKEAVHHVERPR
jgi:hypothetical protein